MNKDHVLLCSKERIFNFKCSKSHGKSKEQRGNAKNTFVTRSTTSRLKVCGRVSCPLEIFANDSSSLSLQEPNGISA